MSPTHNFIARSEAIYPEQFDYSQAEYINAKTKIRLLCLLHGEPYPVDISPDHHFNPKKGSGCKKCKEENARRRSARKPDEFKAIALKNYPSGFSFNKEDYVNAKSLINVICTTHDEPFKASAEVITDGRMGGCKTCIIEYRRKINSEVGVKKQISIDEFLARAEAVHGQQFSYDSRTYTNISSSVTVTCNECEYTATPIAQKFLQWKKCPCCGSVRQQRNRLDDKGLTNNVIEVQGRNITAELMERTEEANDSIFKVYCQIHPEECKFIRYGNRHTLFWCKTCKKEEQKRNRLLGKCKEKYGGVYHDITIDEEMENITFTCLTHSTQTHTIKDYLAHGCIHCKQADKQHDFFESLPEEFLEKHDYRNTVVPLSKNKQATISYRCLVHGEFIEGQRLDAHLEGRTGCKACAAEKRKLEKNKTLLSKAASIRKEFLHKAEVMWGTERYNYPHIETEMIAKTSEITIYCQIHELSFPCPADQHIASRNKGSRGRGCPKCKSEKHRETARLSLQDVVKKMSDRNLTIVNPECYVNTSSKLLIRCQNNHVTRMIVGKVLYRHQTCGKCNKLVGEEITRRIVSHYFDGTFKKVRFKPNAPFQYLELDGYNEALSLAFEYQGIYHVDPNVHKSERSWVDQQERDKATRQMCADKGILLIEVPLFSRGTFNLDNILSSLRTGFDQAGIILDESKLPDIESIIEQSASSSSELHKLDRISAQHNLTLLSESRWYGKSYKYNWICNTCGYKFPNSLDQRNSAKHKCCPSCARKIGSKKRAANSSPNGVRYLDSLRQKTAEIGVQLTTTTWLKAGLDKVYNGICSQCSVPVPSFSYNDVLKKRRLCKSCGRNNGPT